MATAPAASPEPAILRARARGEVSPEAAFEQLYAEYSRVVLAWFAFRVDAADVDDLFQDVWLIFYNRWRDWRMLPEMEAPEARPVLSFLFRTAHFVLLGHRRRPAARAHEPIEELEIPDGARSPERMLDELQVGKCLQLAREICPPEELDVLLAKLAGVPAREIARTLQMSEPAVDHRFRDALARLQKRLQAPRQKGGAAQNV